MQKKKSAIFFVADILKTRQIFRNCKKKKKKKNGMKKIKQKIYIITNNLCVCKQYWLERIFFKNSLSRKSV